MTIDDDTLTCTLFHPRVTRPSMASLPSQGAYRLEVQYKHHPGRRETITASADCHVAPV